MKIMNHLNDDQLTGLLLESNEKYLRQHISDLPEWTRASAERPEDFWRRQQISIRSKLDSQNKGGFWRISPLLASAAAIIMLAMVMLSSPHHRSAPPAPVQSENDRDLLLQVEQLTQSNGPEALQPAALLADEISQNTTGVDTASGHVKEKNTHEN